MIKVNGKMVMYVLDRFLSQLGTKNVFTRVTLLVWQPYLHFGLI